MMEAAGNENQKLVLGFVILSHSASPLLARLIATLNRIYGDPPIVIHHDFSQSPLPLASNNFGRNVSVVQPHYRTRWGHISIVDAFLTSLEILFKQHAPDWFSLLSAACYPAATGKDVLDELARAPYDAYLDHSRVSLNPPADLPAGIRRWIVGCYHRYVATVRPPVSPFSTEFECYAGGQWLTANAKSAEILIASRRERNELFYHYTNVVVPDESFYQTVLCNHRDLRICGNRRFADWSLGGDHPRELGEEDLEAIVKSGCHFARKVSAQKSAGLLDALDRIHFGTGPR